MSLSAETFWRELIFPIVFPFSLLYFGFVLPVCRPSFILFRLRFGSALAPGVLNRRQRKRPVGPLVPNGWKDAAAAPAVPRVSSATWGSVVAAAAGAGGRALVAGCGGHLLFRFVVHHLVPLLLRRLRCRRRRQQPRPPLGPSSARADTEVSESERAKKEAKVGGEEEAEEEEEERDGPVTPLPPADNVYDEAAGGDGQVRSERCGTWWWLWDGSQNRESLRLGAFLASSTHLLPARHALHQHLTYCAVCCACGLRSDGRLSRGGVCAAAITRHRRRLELLPGRHDRRFGRVSCRVPRPNSR